MLGRVVSQSSPRPLCCRFTQNMVNPNSVYTRIFVFDGASRSMREEKNGARKPLNVLILRLVCGLKKRVCPPWPETIEQVLAVFYGNSSGRLFCRAMAPGSPAWCHKANFKLYWTFYPLRRRGLCARLCSSGMRGALSRSRDFPPFDGGWRQS